MALTGCDNETLMHPENSFILLQNWLCSGKFETMDYISGFLQKMESAGRNALESLRHMQGNKGE